MTKTKEEYLAFDKFIKAHVKKGELYIGMSNMQLKEALKNLGIRRVKNYDDSGRAYVNNAYPKQKQLDYVSNVIDKQRPIQEKIDKSIFYSKDKRNNYHAKDIVYYKNKIYKKGQFLPRGYTNE